LQALFKQNSAIWHQMKLLYGKKIKNFILASTRGKVAFNTKFCNYLVLLELRLNIILIRTQFVSKLLVANNVIQKGYALVNSKKKKKNYVLNVGCNLFYNILNSPRFLKRGLLLQWRTYKRRRFMRIRKKRRLESLVLWPNFF
jgi:hypothetical protein